MLPLWIFVALLDVPTAVGLPVALDDSDGEEMVLSEDAVEAIDVLAVDMTVELTVDGAITEVDEPEFIGTMVSLTEGEEVCSVLAEIGFEGEEVADAECIEN